MRLGKVLVGFSNEQERDRQRERHTCVCNVVCLLMCLLQLGSPTNLAAS